MNSKIVEVSRDEFSKNKTQNTRMPYRHPNYNSDILFNAQTQNKINMKIQVTNLVYWKEAQLWNLIIPQITEVVATIP
jgi:hypothetical protein